MSKNSDKRKAALKAGYRSGLEDDIAKQLEAMRVKYTYEELKISYTVPESKHKYTADFVLPNGIVVESKGRFVTADRKKHLLIKQQYPDLDLRFVFSNPRCKISKVSQTTYGMWCEKHGFKYATKTIPEDWINETGTNSRES